MAEILGGYQPDTRSESSRRADFDLRRRISRSGGGGGEGEQGPPGPPGVVQAVIGGANVTVDATNPAYPVVSATGGGGTGADEVWIGPTAPTDPAIELWFDTDAVAPVVASTQIIAVPYASWPPVGPLPNVLYLRLAP